MQFFILIYRIPIMIKVYGIKNCDTMKKTFSWLDAHNVEYQFIDYKIKGVVAEQIDVWLSRVAWETLINTRGMMWRKIPDDKKANLNKEIAYRLIIEYPSSIKRPIITYKNQVLVGFHPDLFEKELLV